MFFWIYILFIIFREVDRDIFGRLELIIDLKVIVVSIKVKDNCRWFWGNFFFIENVVKVRVYIKNCK